MRVRGPSARLLAMQIVAALERLGGVCDAATLLRMTSRRKIRTALRRGEIVRQARGRYALPSATDALQAANRLTAVVSHLSAAAYWGWELKQQPDLPWLTVPRNRNLKEERREGLHVHWADLRPDEIAYGCVTSAARTVIDCARTLPFDEALAVADSALRHGNVTKALLLELAEQVTGKGRDKCLRVVRAATGKAANPFESVLRAIALDVRGLALEPQVVVVLGDRAVRPDLVDETRRLVVEAESFEWHGRRKALARDCERYNLLGLGGWLVIRFSWEHVMLHPEYVGAVLSAVTQARRPVRRANVPDLALFAGIGGSLPVRRAAS